MKEYEVVRELCMLRNISVSVFENVEQYKVLGLLCMHRCAGIAYYHLKQNQMLPRLHREMRTTLQSIYESNLRKTNFMQKSLNYLAEIFQNVNFSYALLKGAKLIEVYPPGTRTSNDIDILINRESIPEVAKLLLGNGFQQGCIRNNQFYKATRRDIVNALLNRGETTPFVKQVNWDNMKYLEIDINISVDETSNDKANVVKTMLEHAVPQLQTKNRKLYTLDAVDFLIHLFQIRKSDSAAAVYLKLEEKSGYCVKYSFDKDKWQVLYEAEKDRVEFNEVGIYVGPQISPFFNEFYPSHLQLCFSKSTKTLMPHVDMEDRYFSKMLEVYHIPKEILRFSDENILVYYQELLSKKYYVRLRLNEFYVPGTPSYKKLDFSHVNYLYGYDREREVFKVIGYNRYLIFTEISFDEFLQAIKYDKQLRDKITLYKYNSIASVEEFPVEAAVFNLKAYVKGDNRHLVTPDKMMINNKNLPFVYGLRIYETIAESTEYIEYLLKDVRLVYKLKERYIIVKDMVDLLSHTHVLTEEDAKMHMNELQILIQFVDVLQEMILKHYIKSISDIHVKISKRLYDLTKMDREATVKLIENLEKCLVSR